METQTFHSAPWLAALCLVNLVHITQASVMVFQNSPVGLIQGLTPTLTLNCSVSDTAASTSIIGRRDVTHTADNVQMLTSLVVTKDGRDLASVTSTRPAHVMDGSSNVQVSGRAAGSSGYITLTISEPTANQTGDYVCEANTVSAKGHGVTFSSTAEVGSSRPTLDDLVAVVRDFRRKMADLDQKNQDLETKIGDLVKNNQDLEKTNAVLEQTVATLKNKSETMVFFNARINGRPHYAAQKNVVFDSVRDNKGNNYNGANGLCTCTVPGYYHFSLGCLSMPEKIVGMYLAHNSHAVFYIHGRSTTGNSYQAAANTGTLQLAKGDVVKIHTDYDSTIDGPYCSFSGHLIEAL